MGGQNWLKSSPPCVIVAENWNTKQNDMEKFLEEFGFKIVADSTKHGMDQINQIFYHQTCEPPEEGIVIGDVKWSGSAERWYKSFMEPCEPIQFITWS